MRSCHCDCAGHGWNMQSCCCCNVSSGSSSLANLTNPSCTSSTNEWLPCRKDIEPTKIKDLNFDSEDFEQCGEKKRLLVVSPKKRFNPLARRIVLNGSIESLLKLSKTKVEFLENLDLLSIEKIRQMEVCSRGHYCDEQSYLCRKGVINSFKGT